MADQASTYRCERCGHEVAVVQLSAYAFNAPCAHCGKVNELRWPDDEPPPTFTPTPSPPPRMPERATSAHPVGCLCETCSAQRIRDEWDPRMGHK